MLKQAVIVAGGLGTRLRPLTNKIPKVMIPILGKPLLEHHVEQFKKHGVVDFFFTLHYLSEVIKNYFGDGKKWGVKINYQVEKEPLGTAGGLKKFEKKLDPKFFYIYGDTFSLVDYSKMSVTFNKLKNAIGMQRVALAGENYADADLVQLGRQNLFLKIFPKPHAQKPDSAYRMRGIFILDKKILSYIPQNKFYEIGKNLLPEIINHGEKFYGYLCDDYSRGIDTIEKYHEVEKHLQSLILNP